MLKKSYFWVALYGMVMLNSGLSIGKAMAQGSASLLAQRKQEISRVLAQPYPVIRLKKAGVLALDSIQDLLLTAPQMTDYYTDVLHNKKILNEVFSVSPARINDFPTGGSVCASGTCFRVEVYSYAYNVAIVGIVNVVSKKLISFTVYKEAQPDLPPHLVDLALEIARNDSMVVNAYGPETGVSTPLMPGTKTALNRTKCQRSKHLCVAPTFVKGDKALWAIVDLTDLNVAGVRWTNVGETGMAVTQRKMQNDKIMECFCDKDNAVAREGWSFKYSLSRSDGLVVSDVRFKDRALFRSVKLVDWHVSYSKTEGFGYSDAVGCPEFSTAAVLAVEPPYFEPILQAGDTIGFLLGQRYYSEGWPTPCNYNYHQYFEFYKDGSFRPVGGSIGRGCGNNGMYRPVTRIALASPKSNIFEWKNKNWSKWTKEQWTLQTENTQYGDDQKWMKIATEPGRGMYLVANTGQLRDAGRGDNAYVYVTQWDAKKDEGETDLPTIGPCCNRDYHQGPEKFIEPKPDPIADASLVLWYVAQIGNDDTKGKEYCWAESVIQNGVFVPIVYPCYSGPLFKLY